MNPWVALLVFLCSIADDVLYVFFVQVIIRKKYWYASALSGLLTGIVGFGVLMYANLADYLLPNVLGSLIGTPMAMWVDAKHFSRTMACHLKSNCPKCGRICSGIAAEISERGLGRVVGECKTHGRVELSGWSYDDFVVKTVVKIKQG